MATQYDVHTCGSCKVEFLSIESFIHHKQKSCPFLQPANSEHQGQDVFLVLKPRGNTSKGLDMEKVHKAIQAQKSSPVKIKSSTRQPVRIVGQNSPAVPQIHRVQKVSPVVQSMSHKSPVVGGQPIRFGLLHPSSVPQRHIVSQTSSVVQTVPNSLPVPQVSLVRKPIRYVQQISQGGKRTFPSYVTGNDTIKKAVFPSQTLSRISSSQEIDEALEFLKPSTSTSTRIFEARQQSTQVRNLDAQETAAVSRVVVEPVQGSRDAQYTTQGCLGELHAGTLEDDFAATADADTTSRLDQVGPLNQALEFLKQTEDTILLQEFYDVQVKKEVNQMSQSVAEGYVSEIPTRLCCIKSSKDSASTQVEGEVGQLINQALLFLKPAAKADDGESIDPMKQVKFIDPGVDYVDTEDHEHDHVVFEQGKFVNQGAFFLNPDRTVKPAEDQIRNAVKDVQTPVVLCPARVLNARLGDVLTEQDLHVATDTSLETVRIGSCREAREEGAIINQASFFLKTTKETRKPNETNLSRKCLSTMVKNAVKPTKASVVSKKRARRKVNHEYRECSSVVQSEESVVAQRVPHRCQYCHKVFHRKGFKEKHEHDKQNMVQRDCEICMKVFETRCSWKIHMKLHEPERKPRQKFLCEKCDKKYTSEFLLEHHKRRHEGKDDCALCGRICRTERIWRRHMMHHNPTEACEDCDKKFISKVMLERHQRSTHRSTRHVSKISAHRPTRNVTKGSSNRANQKCEICDRVFFWGESLRRHMRIHKVGPSKARKPKWTKLQPTPYMSAFASGGNKQLNEIHDSNTTLMGAGTGSSKDTSGQLGNEESTQLSEEDSDDALIREAVLRQHDRDESDAGEKSEPEAVQFVAEVMATGAVNLKVTKRKREERPLTVDAANKRQVENKSTDKVAKKRKVEDTNDSDASGLTEGVNNLRCVLCKNEFENKFSFITHGCITIKPLMCKHCERKFDNLKKFRLHQVQHREGFECDRCDVNFRSVDNWQSHMKEHEGEGAERHKCESCVLEFFREESLLLHARKHASQNDHECSMCPRVFLTKYALKKHEESHVEPEYYQCKICQKNFVFKEKFKLHTRNCRRCRECNEAFPHSGAYSKHKRQVHPVIYVCEHCGRKCKTMKTHLKHLKRHDNPLRCKVCDRIFKFKCQLVDHEVIHFSARPLKCTFCEKTFKVERARISHEHFCHPNENPWKCKLCGEKFLERFDFRMHVQSCSEQMK